MTNHQNSNIEADVVPGLEPIARDEISNRLGRHVQQLALGDGLLTFSYSGDLRELLKLRSVLAVYAVQSFPVPRPKALLGHQYFTAIASAIETLLHLHPADAFRTIRLAAAGEESAVLTRLREELAAYFSLNPTTDEADLLLRLRPNNSALGSQSSSPAWQVLTRISPRPLVTRSWRVSNMPGALNATVAYAMAKLTQPKADDMFLNLACGSGSLLIERLAMLRTAVAIGCDIDPTALRHAATNLAAFPYGENASLCQCDAAALPLKSSSVTALVADLPFGSLIGSHEDNERLYPLLLREAARVARSGARFTALTHELKLMQRLLPSFANYWRVEQTLRVQFGGLTPMIYLLRRQ